MPQKKLIAANWKMNAVPTGALETSSPFRTTAAVDVVVLPTFLDLQACIDAGLTVGAQYARPEATGAFTGDIGMQMVKDLGATYVLCGHSDRRKFHGETNEEIAAQARSAIALGLHPIICVGETLEERTAGTTDVVVEAQVRAILPLVTGAVLTLAYEPVWAISRGDAGKDAAPSAEAEAMHRKIRSWLPQAQQANIRILYGASMKPGNAAELLSQPNIDGGLIGGASLKPEEFAKIVTAASNI